MAIQAALTGHLVLSTLHTNDSPSSVSRLLELGAPSYLVKATLRGIMSQRLVRILCPDCKRAVPSGSERAGANSCSPLTFPCRSRCTRR
jgi:general secretion pathway protein E